MFTAAVITVSDKGYAGEREDLSGPAIRAILEKAGYKVLPAVIVPDEAEKITDALHKAAAAGANLILTSGGTGFSPRDVTPEATASVIERPAPGIAEAIRANSMKYTDRAMLSRGIAGIVGKSLVVNLPGSPKAVKESLEFILPAIHHGLEILLGASSECARKD
ncbi:MAG TPA: MogA/MoaB family molybdenum cofactor biosynthesis protein [Eubacteriales bacterium]|jgi:molybdenum cofactor synthesis domain-containing protein|nr:MogA/MoaB family molybdenum cofactor biosynthesis protein [Clostridia bacterium]HRR89535.1 MogA/MoaB family molybdenum cofactor biosynthesis protein [Eubacteriales bacterium]HRU83884.1 MogA/MoaB family molybdenum cofactor biosynthesis protein [Eubacteriales bacterium]